MIKFLILVVFLMSLIEFGFQDSIKKRFKRAKSDEFVEISLNDTEALKALNFVVKHLNQELENGSFLYKLVKVNKILRQDFVIKYVFYFTIGETSCIKMGGATQAIIERCQLQNDFNQKNYRVEVLYRPWVGSQSVYTIEGINDKVDNQGKGVFLLIV
jgi:hypothetical protein